MLEAKIYKDNQEPPKNSIWHKVSDAGKDFGYYKNTNNKWNKVDVGNGGGIGEDSDENNNNDDIEYYKMNNIQDNIHYALVIDSMKLSSIIINNNLITEIVHHSSDTIHYSPMEAWRHIGSSNNINNFAFSINKNIDVIYSINGNRTIIPYGNLYEKMYYYGKNNLPENESENENVNMDESINALKQVFIPISKEEYYSLATNV